MLNLVLKRLGGREPTLNNCFPLKKLLLLSDKGVGVLQDIVCKRDQTNTGVTRKEAIQIVVDIRHAKSFKQAENHLDYLIREKAS